ncbi:Pycsar system effector family protein [Actinoplanes sp. NPDC051494]|uniref:Pycsar system effector family protein n=1 Tax=Actinoplanes sp. NPDC051494 TaxID=3363907 RepID=UPI0037AF3780
MTDQLNAVATDALTVHELADIRAHEARADNKAFQALGATTALIAASVGAIIATKPSGPAVAASVACVLVQAAGGVLAGTAFIPRLAGNHGPVRWARENPALIHEQLLEWAERPDLLAAARTRQIHHLSRAVTRRYRAVRRALLVLAAAVPLAAVATALTR